MDYKITDSQLERAVEKFLKTQFPPIMAVRFNIDRVPCKKWDPKRRMTIVPWYQQKQIYVLFPVENLEGGDAFDQVRSAKQDMEMAVSNFFGFTVDSDEDYDCSEWRIKIVPYDVDNQRESEYIF